MEFNIDDVILEAGEDGPTGQSEAREAEVVAPTAGPVRQPNTQAAAPKANPAPAAPVANPGVPAVAASNLPARKLELDDQEKRLISTPGVSVVRFGETVSRFPIEKLKFTTQKKNMIAILSDHAITVKTHFREEDLKSFLCFGGECCEVCGLPNVKYLLPAFVYDTNDKGTPVSQDLTLKVLSLSQNQYQQLADINTAIMESSRDENGDSKASILTTDLWASCTDEQWQKVTFTQLGVNRWRKYNKQVVQELVKLWKDNKHHIYKAIAKSIDAKKFRQAIGDEAPASEVSAQNLD